MKPVDVGATVGADGVEIKLPRLRVVVERRQAERLRDALFAVLPKASEQTPPTGEPCAYCAGTGYGPGGLPQEPRLHLLSIAGDVEPELSGQYDTEDERVEAAQDYRRAHGPEDGLFRVDATGTVKVDTFTGAELEPVPRRCTLCRCDATGERFGFPVCAYHVDHTEDDPQCPECAGKYLLVMHGDVEPELHGPFSTEAIRDDAARLHRKEHGDEDGLFRVDATGNVEIASFTGAEVDEWEAR